MSHGLFKSKVKLEPIKHIYTCDEGNEYKSVTTLLKTIAESFEDTFAYKNASEEKRAEWKEKGRVASDHGTRIHNALELYNETGQILKENSDLEQAIKSIIDDYKGYHKCYDEVCLYNKEHRIAGTADKICALSNRKDCDVDISDILLLSESVICCKFSMFSGESNASHRFMKWSVARVMQLKSCFRSWRNSD